MKIIEYCQIDTLLDIGANTGQFGQLTRALGYKNRIISFEPLNGAFKVLEKTAQRDEGWKVYNYALGNEDVISTLNISKNSFSSSILEMLPEHLLGSPASRYIDYQKIESKNLIRYSTILSMMVIV